LKGGLRPGGIADREFTGRLRVKREVSKRILKKREKATVEIKRPLSAERGRDAGGNGHGGKNKTDGQEVGIAGTTNRGG